MLKITFKNVGQGDSIILEWFKEGARNIGIIDCNIFNGSNPTLDFIKDNKVTEIKFIILSHPHFDHYSGLSQLLSYCRDNEVIIRNFLHTSSQVPSFMKTAAKTALANKELSKLFKLTRELNDSMGMGVFAIQADSMFDYIELGENMGIKILDPSLKELDSYIAGVDFGTGTTNEGPHDNPKANWLSTVLKIKIEDNFLLLTSDADKKTLIRIDKKKGAEITSSLLLGQSPHHGALSNHNNSFWKKRNRNKNTPIVFSVGENHYNHPSKDAVNFFIEHSYKLYATNMVGALQNESKAVSEARSLLDMFSVKKPHNGNISDLEGDKEFSFNVNGEAD